MTYVLPTMFAVFFIIFPFFLRKLSERIGLTKIFSDLVLCFGVGILLGNTHQFWLSGSQYLTAFSLAEICATAPVLLAIPMLLMTSDIRACLNYAPKLLLSFTLCIVSVLLSTVLVLYMFPDLTDIGKALGCMIGVYVGGTPNMMAVSYAVDVPAGLLEILIATDVFCSGLYFLFLLTLANVIFGFFLPKFVRSEIRQQENIEDVEINQFNSDSKKEKSETIYPRNSFTSDNLIPLIKATMLSLLAIGISVVAAKLFPDSSGNLNKMLLMIILTTISILFSFIPKIQSLKGVYDYAQYLLLIFALAVGFMADFSKLANDGGSYLLFNAVFVAGLVFIHLFLAIIFRIDRDSFIITSAACVFGPPFIGQVCSSINNRTLVAPGMALGVLGLVIGTYLGIIVSGLLI
jgi:uncharacterized membrane protein